MKYAFTITRDELYERLRSGAGHIFDHEALPISRGWKHTFSMAPVASRKRVAEALYRKVVK